MDSPEDTPSNGNSNALTLPGLAGPSGRRPSWVSQFYFYFFIISWVRIREPPPRSLPFCSPPRPAVERREQSSPTPKSGHRQGEKLCVCLLPWPKHCAIWQSEGAFAGVSGVMGQRKRIQAVVQQRQQLRRWRRRRPSRPHLLAECRGNGRHRSSPSPRQSKQDRWALRPGMIKDEPWIHLHQS